MSQSIVMPAIGDEACLRGNLAASATTWAAALLLIAPFVWTEHRFPLTSLDSEVVAAVCLGVASVASAFLRMEKACLNWKLPALTLLLGGITLVHLALGHLTYSHQAGRLLLSLAAILCAYVLGRQLVAARLVDRAVDALAVAAMAGATFSALIQWMQLCDLELLPSQIAVVMNDPAYRLRPFGNVAQANHLVTYLAVGAVSALYLNARGLGRLSRVMLGAALLILSSGVALTGSRMGLLHESLVLALIWIGNGIRPSSRRARVFLTLSIVAGYVAGYAAGVIALRMGIGGADVIARFGEGSLAFRFEMWRQALVMIAHHPLLGVGFGQFPAEQLAIARAGPFAMPSNNCHNLVLQVAAESGLPAACLLVAYVVAWYRRDWRARIERPVSVFAASVVALVLVHSLLEFPLWYLYFAVPVAVLFAIDEPADALTPATETRRIMALAGVSTIVIGLIMKHEYLPVAKAGEPLILDSRGYRARMAQDSLGILEVYDSKLFRPEVERLVMELKHPPDEKTDGPLARSERVLKMLTGPELIAYRILILTQRGRVAEALPYVDRLSVFSGKNYPTYRDWLLEQTKTLGPETAPLRHALREQRWIRAGIMADGQSAPGSS